MPISREEFEKGEVEPLSFVLQFFRSNPDTGYSLQEVYAMLGSQVNLDIDSLKKILGLLKSQQKVEVKTIAGVVYYIYYRRPIGFRPS